VAYDFVCDGVICFSGFGGDMEIDTSTSSKQYYFKPIAEGPHQTQ
jgi:hypothetical protein